MRSCPKCGQTYNDANINFCLNDGELLNDLAPIPPTFADEPPPTVIMDGARVTNPVSWPAETPISQPPVPQWQSPQYSVQPAGQFGSTNASLDQTLPLVSIILAGASLVMVCCYGGLWLGIPAIIVGFLGMSNAKRDPSTYGGKTLAIVGMAIGAVSLLASLSFILLAIIGNLGNL